MSPVILQPEKVNYLGNDLLVVLRQEILAIRHGVVMPHVRHLHTVSTIYSKSSVPSHAEFKHINIFMAHLCSYPLKDRVALLTCLCVQPPEFQISHQPHALGILLKVVA